MTEHATIVNILFPIKISIHKDKSFIPSAYGSGFKVVECWDLQELEYYICNYVWSPCVWKDGIRLKKNFESAALVALDFDEGVSILQAYDDFEQFAYILAPTKSHQQWKGDKEPCDRFRVILPVPAFTELKTYEKTMHKIIKSFGGDPAAKDGARFFFPCIGVDFSQECGDTLNVYAQVESESVLKLKEIETPKKNYAAKAYLQDFHTRGAFEQGSRNQTVFKIACELCRQGLDEEQIYGYVIDKTDMEPERTRRTIQSAITNELSQQRSYNGR